MPTESAPAELARLPASQDADGQWAGGAFFPAGFDGSGDAQPYTATTWSLNALREWGLDVAVLRERRTAELLAANSRWEYDDLPYWGGEVDCCINGWTLANGVWLGADVDVDVHEPSKWLTFYGISVLNWWDS